MFLREETTGLRLALGLALLGQSFVLLGIAGLLRPWIFVLIAIALTVGGIVRGLSPIRWTWLRWPSLVLIAIAALPFLLLALFPPIAFDETLYHLPFVQALARSGSIEFFGELRFPAFPLLHELLCLPLFLALGDTATHLVSLAELIVLAVLLLDTSRGDRRITGILVASLCLGHPIIVQIATVGHVDMALMLFIAAGTICLDRTSDPNPQSSILNPQSRYAAAAGFLLGTACCVKYLGWYFVAAGFAYLLLFSPARKRTVPIFLCALAIAVLPTYGEIVRFTGNPVHPFLTSIFGETPWELPPAPAPASRIVTALRLFWDVTFARERLNQQPPYSPLFAVAFAVALFAAIRNRRAAFVVAISVAYIAIFTFLPQDSRYLLPLFPLISIVAARAIASRVRTQPRANAIAATLSLVAIAPAFAYAGYRFVKQGLPPATPAQRHVYLAQRIPEYRALQKRGPGITYLCGAEQLQGFGRMLGDRMLGDINGLTPVQKILGESRDAADLARTFERIGATNLLLSRARCPAAWQNLPREPHFRLIYEDEGATLWRVQSAKASPPPIPDTAR